jgi:hypothetical protein
LPLILKIGDPQQTSVFGVETHNVVGTLDKLNVVGTDWVRRNGLLWSEVEKLGAFGDFMYATVQKYSQPPYNVKYWEMWNEPDAATSFFRKDPHTPYGCWGDEAAADYGRGYYADMLQAVYPRIKQATPYA